MANLKDKITKLETSFFEELKSSSTIEQIEEVRVKFLSRKGLVQDIMAEIKNFSVEEKREWGPKLNKFKTDLEESFEKQKEKIQKQILKQEISKKQNFDVSSTKINVSQGNLHVLTKLTQQIENIFLSMGFKPVYGPEVETDFYNFEALNIAKDHPARDMQDTFWLNTPEMLLRTHTSSVQIRTMEKSNLPLAVVATGRVFRNEATDASHDYMFNQLEGLYIDKNVSMANLFGTIKTFLSALFDGKEISIRVRPSFFPFVEPGAEIDMTCPFCENGCSVCKKTKWIEILGAGLVHPNVLKSVGIDPNKYSGFAFGMGATRLAMLKYGIKDIRLLHSGKIDFLKQF
ncbi:MAG: Phenylalanine-tRNA ligase alpha subunit [candidate division TM6 bacterium GW2011_GWF2_32_72]|nr:MAG: Phenylalanine-tRNA ligase alpha subunit [candidate division TM6 bacterium GW2011_GWF2_32_72]